MPDITMCSNSECPLKQSCYRFMAIPTEHWQAYCKFEPEWKDEELENTKCKHYVEIKGERIRQIE